MASADFLVKKNLRVKGTDTSTIDGSLSVAGSISSSGVSVLTTANKGVADGVATLDATAKVPVSQLPALSATPAGSAGMVQYHNLSVDETAGAAGLLVDANGCLTLPTNIVPATPSSGTAALFSKDLSGRTVPSFASPLGRSLAFQAGLYESKVGMWVPTGNATTVTSFGIAAPSTTGTATARNVATTNLFTSQRRIGYVSATTAGSSCAARLAALQFWRGNTTGLGGFFFSIRFGISDAASVATARMFVGLYGSAAVIGNVQPTSLINTIGVGCDSGEAVLKMIWNDSSGSASTLSLGANFPSNTRNTDMYELRIYAASNTSTVNYEVTRIGTSFVSSGQLTTDIPISTQLLAPQMWRNNGTTALAAGIDLVSMYIETDY